MAGSHENPKSTGDSRLDNSVSKEALSRIGTALEAFGLLKTVLDLTAEETAELWDYPENWSPQKIVGQQWRTGNEQSYIEVLLYGKTVRKPFGRLFKAVTGVTYPFHLHGQLNFRNAVEGADFSGAIYFIGDGQDLEEVSVYSQYVRGNENSQKGMIDFSRSIGLQGIVAAALQTPELDTVPFRIWVQEDIGDDIADAMHNLQTAASGSS